MAQGDMKEARRKLAVALAIEDGELTPEQGEEWLEIDDELEQIQSEHYPGDEYFDQAQLELEGY